MQACNMLCNKIQNQVKKKCIQDDKMKKKKIEINYHSEVNRFVVISITKKFVML